MRKIGTQRKTNQRFAIAIFLLVLLTTCDENIVDPKPEPGRRDYVWEVDTLFLPFNFFTDITGTSPSDLWACGPGGDLDKTLYHFDGNRWESDLISRSYSPLSIFGVSKYSVWSCGIEGKIWRFNGTWKEHHSYSDSSITDLISIKEINSGEVLCVGHYFVGQDKYGIILRYDGQSWKRINIPQTKTTFADIEVSANNQLYIWGVTNEQYTISTYQFYELKDGNINEIFSGAQNRDENGSLLQLGELTYFIIGDDFYTYSNTEMIKVGSFSGGSNFLNVSWGRNEKDIFLGMRDGIAHYNGVDTEYIFKNSEDIFVRLGIVFENEVFFIGRDAYGNNLMINGKLLN